MIDKKLSLEGKEITCTHRFSGQPNRTDESTKTNPSKNQREREIKQMESTMVDGFDKGLDVSLAAEDERRRRVDGIVGGR